MTKIGFAQGPLAQYAGPGHWNDPDMLEVGNGGMTADEYRTHMSLWALLAAPLLAGNDLSKMTPETKSILMNKAVIAIDQDRLGAQGDRVSKDGDLEIWSKPLSGGGRAVGLFNRGTSEAGMSLKLSDVGVVAKRDSGQRPVADRSADGAVTGASFVGGSEVAFRTLATPWSKTASVRVSGREPARLHVTNVWTGSAVVDTNGVVTEPVPAHGVVLLRVEP